MAASGPIYSHFDPVGFLPDFLPAQKSDWNIYLQKIFAERVSFSKYNNGPRPQFFDPTKVSKKSDFTPLPVDWPAFPKYVSDTAGADKYRVADESRDSQDEYCEWSVQRNGEGKITRITFTSEPRDHYIFLAKSAEGRSTILSLYHTYVSPDVKAEDLFDGDEYNYRSKWNDSTTGSLMHLISDPNNLFAEIELGAGASIVRRKDGHILKEQDKLIMCSQYGDERRNSDPTIGAAVNEQARKGASISFQNPVGLYLGKFDPKGWVMPNPADDPRDFFKIVRGTTEFPVRAVFEVPPGKGYTVSDITVLGEPINFGGQVTESLRIKLVAIAQGYGGTVHVIDGCTDDVSSLSATHTHALMADASSATLMSVEATDETVRPPSRATRVHV